MHGARKLALNIYHGFKRLSTHGKLTFASCSFNRAAGCGRVRYGRIMGFTPLLSIVVGLGDQLAAPYRTPSSGSQPSVWPVRSLDPSLSRTVYIPRPKVGSKRWGWHIQEPQ